MRNGNDAVRRSAGAPRKDRSKIVLECEVRQGSRPWKLMQLEDLSQTGFRIAWYPYCRPELPLRIRMRGLEMLTAHVRWQKDGAVGCEFIAPLHIAVFEHLVRQASRKPA